MEQEVNLNTLRPALNREVDINDLILSSKQHLETMFDSITDPIFLVKPDFTIERLNAAAALRMEDEYRNIIGKKCYEKFHGRNKPCEECPHTEAYHHRKKGSLKMHKRIAGKDHVFDLRYFPLYDKNGEVRSVVEHYVDITEGETAKRLLEEAFERIKEEIKVAKNIQEALLPPSIPVIPGLKIAVHYKPMEDIGGDLYDFIPVTGDRWGVIIADVSGHGIPASLMGAMAKMSFYNHTPGNLSTLDVFDKVNRDLFNNLMMEYYISGEYLIFDTLNHSIRFSRAGHPEALLLRAATGEVEKLHTRGYFLGIMMNGEFEEAQYKLNKGDRLFLYTDGLVETEDAAGMKFGVERVRALLRETRTESLEGVKTALITAVEHYGRGLPVQDDLTFILLEVTEEDALQRFKLQEHFTGDGDIRIFRAMHPFDFSQGILQILEAMKKAWYTEDDKESVKAAAYEALDLMYRTSVDHSEGLCLAWQCGKEEIRIVVTDKRFEGEQAYAEKYASHHPDALRIIQEKMTRLIFPSDGRKILLCKHNSKY